jgi:hypothetical protein
VLGGEEKDGYCASCRSTAAPVSKRSFCIREGVVIAVGLGLVHDSVCVDSLAIPAQSSFCYLQCGCVFGLYRGREPGSFGTDEIVKSRNDDVGQQIVVA